MVKGKRTRSKGAAANGKANEFLAKRKIPRGNESGKLAVRSSGVTKYKVPADKYIRLALYVIRRYAEDEFREKNPNAPVDRAYINAAVADKWNAMSDADKALFVAKHNKGYEKYLAEEKIACENGSGKADSKLAVRRNEVEMHKKPAAKGTRRTTALFFFQHAFDKEFREKNPNAPVDRACLDAVAADKWKTMSDLDKAPYVAMLKKRHEQDRAMTMEMVQMLQEMNM